ncbi:MAG: metallophosphoesterase [Nitrososphaeraceae archaeon]
MNKNDRGLTEEKIQVGNNTEKDSQHNNNFVFIASGDWDCNENTVNTVNNIDVQNPDLVISTGDMSYDDNGSCFFETLDPIISKLKISLGNHDTSKDGKKELQDEYEAYFKLKKPFYSFDYKNTHFIIMNSNQNTNTVYFYEQYSFVENDLKKTKNNSSIDWTIVVIHEPFYTNPGSHPPNIEFAKLYHPLFDKYGVDLVLSGHNHWYERTLPLKFNKNDPSSPLTVVDYVRVKLNNDTNAQLTSFGTLSDTFPIDKFDDSEYPTFITVGTAGRKQHNQDGYLPYITSVWDNGFGFLKINVTENTLFGEFYANEIAGKSGKKIIDPNYLVRDKFIILKNNDYRSNT